MSNKNRALMFDVVFLSGVTIFGEIIGQKALQQFSSGYYFTITLLIAFIAIYRIGYLGVIPAVVTGLVFSFLYETATIETFIVYGVGNICIVTSAVFLKFVGREKVHENSTWAILYVLTGYISIIIGRGVISFALDSSTNLISALFSVLANEFLGIIAVTLLFSMISKRKHLLIDLNALYDEAEIEQNL